MNDLRHYLRGFSDGAQARLRLTPAASNPYPTGSIQHDGWQDGWRYEDISLHTGESQLAMAIRRYYFERCAAPTPHKYILSD